MKDKQKGDVKCFSYRTLTVVELATENCTNTRSSSMSLCPEVVTGELEYGVYSKLQVRWFD
jgi:hypothetical protein